MESLTEISEHGPIMDIIKGLDINSLIKLHLSNKNLNKIFNTECVLNTLSDLYKINYGATFLDFIKEYDDVYLKKGCSLTKKIKKLVNVQRLRRKEAAGIYCYKHKKQEN